MGMEIGRVAKAELAPVVDNIIPAVVGGFFDLRPSHCYDKRNIGFLCCRDDYNISFSYTDICLCVCLFL